MKKIIESKILCPFTKEIEEKFKLGSVMHELALKNNSIVNVYAIKYRSRGLLVAGFVVEPKGKSGDLPGVIWNRGGSKDYSSISLLTCYSQIARLALKGYIVFASQYSGGPGSDGIDDWGGDNIQDVLLLKKVIEEWPNTNFNSIGMIGFSRGGMMTYRALSLVKWIRAAIIVAGPTDEVAAPKFRKSWRDHQISLYGKSKKEQIRRSAFYWPEKIYKKTPILIMHGSADLKVNILDSIKIAEKLYEQKIPFRFIAYEGADHVLSEFKKESNEQIFNWFERFLKNTEPLPNLKLHDG